MAKDVRTDPGASAAKDFIPWFGDPQVIRRILVNFSIGGYNRLIGETGSGKSTIVHTLEDVANGGPFSAKTKAFYADKKHGTKAIDDNFWKTYLGEPLNLYEYSLTQDTSRWDLIATQSMSAGTVEIIPGPMLQWLEDETPDRIKLLFLDEVNYAAPGVTALFNELGDFRQTIRVSEIAIYDKIRVREGTAKIAEAQWGRRRRTEEHWIITAENPYDVTSYAGTNPPNIAQQNRPIPVDIPFMSQAEEIQMLLNAVGGKQALRGRVNDIVTLATQIRAKYREHQLNFVLSPRNTRQLAQILDKTGDWDLVTDTIVDWFPAQDKNEVKGLIGKR